jgi:hypothetical protein
MATINAALERHHRPACTFHDVIPICHYLFNCDHGLHVVM